jgi:hypothetical protein
MARFGREAVEQLDIRELGHYRPRLERLTEWGYFGALAPPALHNLRRGSGARATNLTSGRLAGFIDQWEAGDSR